MSKSTKREREEDVLREVKTVKSVGLFPSKV